MKLEDLNEALQDKVELQKSKEILETIPFIDLAKSKILTILLLNNGPNNQRINGSENWN